jgi:hypothetical protein
MAAVVGLHVLPPFKLFVERRQGFASRAEPLRDRGRIDQAFHEKLFLP